MHATLDELDAALGQQGAAAGLARPDHIVYVTPNGIGKLCPATEPDLPLGKGPVPSLDEEPARPAQASGSPWSTPAGTPQRRPTPRRPGSPATSRATSRRVEPGSAIHEYAGHGTFVAGVVQCLAPGPSSRSRGRCRTAGRLRVRHLQAARRGDRSTNDKPTRIISISAGTHTRKNLGLLGFEILAQATDSTMAPRRRARHRSRGQRQQHATRSTRPRSTG